MRSPTKAWTRFWGVEGFAEGGANVAAASVVRWVKTQFVKIGKAVTFLYILAGALAGRLEVPALRALYKTTTSSPTLG
jgi:hypothetical protein